MDKQKLSIFLTFTGRAEEAMRFYAETLPGASITRLVRYGKERPYPGLIDENRILNGALTFMGQEILFLDLDDDHPAPAFSWASSIYVNCQDEAEFDAIFDAVSRGGTVMMGPEAVGNIRKCAWVTDKFGVTWQPVWE